MHKAYIDLTDDVIAEQNPRFKAASLGKLGEALKKHFQQFPDVYTQNEILNQPAPQVQREDL